MDDDNKGEETNDLGDLNEAFERLDESREESQLGDRGRGRKAGIAWAKEKATYTELKKLGSFILDAECDVDQLFYGAGAWQPSAAERLAVALDWPAMWEDLADGEELSLGWKTGFCDGANDVFEAFSSQYVQV